MSETESTPNPPAVRPKRPRWRRRLAWAAAALALLGALGWLLHPRLLTPVVSGRLSAALERDVHIQTARLTLLGALRINAVRTGGADALEALASAEAHIGWGHLLRGDWRPRRLLLERPILPASRLTPGDESRTPFSLASLADEPMLSALQQMQVEEGALVVGETGGRIRFDAQAVRRVDAHAFDISIVASEEEGDAPRRRSFSGEVDLAARSLSIRGADTPLRPWIAATGVDRSGASGMLRAGRLRSFTLRYADQQGVEIEGDLTGVDVALEAGSGDAAPPPIRDLTGDFSLSPGGVAAQLRGRLESAPLLLTASGGSDFWRRGVDLTIEVTGLDVGPDSVAYTALPSRVRRELAYFSNPTGLVDATVRARAVPATGAVDFAGALHLTAARASFNQFPYPFHDLSARVEFEEDRLAILDVRGVSATGAVITGDAVIAPLTDDAGVDVDLRVEQVALNDDLRAAMSTQQREALRMLFHPDAASVFQRASAPDVIRNGQFTVGGRADVSIRVDRPAGPEGSYTTEVTAAFDEAGLLADEFPYPLLARDLELHVSDGAAAASSDDVRGLTGARGRLDARLDFSEDGGATTPVIEVDMTSLPVDAPLMWAIDEASRRQGAPDGRYARIFERLGLDGSVACAVSVRAGGDGAAAAVTVDASLESMTVRPRAYQAGPAGSTLAMTNVSGALRVDPDSWRLGPVTAQVGEGRVRFDVAGDVGESVSVSDASFEGRGMDLSLPVEDLIAVFAPEVARLVADARDLYRPSGPVDATGSVDATPQGLRDAEVIVTLEGPAAVDILGGRLGMEGESGRLIITHEALTLESLAGESTFDAEPLGALRLGGRVDFSGDGELSINVEGGALENPVAPLIIQRLAGAEAESAYREARVVGRLDASARLGLDRGRVDVRSAIIQPRALSFVRRGEAVAFPKVGGEVVYDGERAAVRELTFTADRWSARLDGAWTTAPERGLDLSITAFGEDLDPGLVATLPGGAADTLKRLGVAASGGFTLQDGRLALRFTSPDDGAAGPLRQASFDGLVWISDGSLDVGLPIRGATGEAAVSFESGTGSPGDLAIELDLERMRIAGADAHAVEGELSMTGDGPARLRLDGRAHQGQWTASGAVATGGSGEFEMTVRLAGMDLAGLTAAAQSDGAAPGGSQPALAGAGSRVDGHITVAGRAGDPASVRGRGAARVTGGGVLRLPIAAQVMEISALQPPTGEELDFAESRFYIDGRRIVFESLLAMSKSIAMLGEGAMTWPDLNLDLRFRTRGNLRAPFLSDVVDALRNELLTAEVTGTLADPQVRLIQLSSTRRLFAEMLTGRRRPAREGGEIAEPVAGVEPQPR